MNKNSKDFKRMNKIKKNSSSISTINSNKYNHPNRYTYELDKKEEIQNSLGVSGILKKSNKKKCSLSSLNINKYYIVKNYNNSSNDNEASDSKDNYLTKISKNSISNFYKHKIEISKIIRKKKIEKLLYYENFYNILKTQDIFYNKNKEKLIDDKLNTTNVFNVHSRLDSFRNNSVSNFFSDMKINKRRNLSKTDIFNEIKLEEKTNKKNKMHSTVIVTNKEKKKNSTYFTDSEKMNEKKEYRMFTSNINNNTSNTNNTPVLMTSLPLIAKRFKYKTKYSNITQSSEDNIEKTKEEIKLNNFSTQKLDNFILESFEDKYKSVKELTKFEIKMFHLKYFQHINKTKLEIILLSDKFNIDRIINRLLKLNKKYNDIWSNYRLKINLYLHFLFDKKNDMETDLGIILHKKKTNENIILGSKDNEMFRLTVRDIFYIESVDKKTFIYGKDNVYQSKLKLYELEEQLGGTKMFRCSKAMIVNLGKIRSVAPSVNGKLDAKLANGETVVISRQYVQALKKRLGM